jgi:hypothetical protein
MALLSADLESASKLARAGRFGDAVELYRELLARDPNHPEAIHFLGICLVRSGGGFMKLGLYSELARRHIVAARSKVAGLEVREARRRLFALPAGDPARKVTARRDFYSASGARDLVLHVHEHRFTVPQLASAIAELGVEFLGFELPGRKLALSLEQWDAYETANPDTFASMYQFWIRKP